MSSGSTGTLLTSVQKQFELLSESSERDLVLILFEPGPGVSLEDALLMCPFSRDHCRDGPPDAQSIVRLRRTDERTIQEFIFASPYAGKTRGEFLKLARDAGNCLGDWAKESGVADAVLAEKGPAVRWMKLLFSFALDRPDFPARAKWYCLNLPDHSSGRYTVIGDAVRCSLYAIDAIAGSKSESIRADAEPIFRPSSDFRSLNWGGELFTFTTTQAACVEVMYQDYVNKTPTLSETSILEAAGSASDRLRDVFKKGKHPAWDTLIVPSGKGMFRLADPD